MENLTIKDIAKMAGVSTTVVSFVINNKPGVNEETRNKVKAVLERTKFKPNLNSRRLILQKSFNICIVLKKDSSPFENLFYFEIARGVLERGKEFGYNIVFADITEENGKVCLPNTIEQKDADGIIFFQDTSLTILNEIQKLGIPYVVVDAHPDKESYLCVTADYEISAYTATKFLILNGHKKISFISSSFIPNFYTKVFSGFKKAIEEKGISIPSSWIQIDAEDEASAGICMERILNSEQKPTAVFCATDVFAIGAMKCARNKGFKVPEDISFVGIDDIILSSYIEPAITTVRIDKIQMGTLAMEILYKRINNQRVESVVTRSDNLIVRDTVRALI